MEELFRLARESANVINRVDPVITHAEIDIPVTSEPVGIIFVSCAHLGGRYTFHEQFERIFDRVLNIDRLYWVSMGDDVEGFLPGFPDASAITDQAIANPKVQRLMLAHVLDKLAQNNKLLCGMASQHGGDWQQKRTGDNPIKDMYLEHKVPFFDGKALVTLRVGPTVYRLALAHEFKGTSQWNANHSQRRAIAFDFPNVDVAIQGDKHRGGVQRFTVPPFEYDAGMVDSYVKWLVQVGTMKQGPDKFSIRGWSRGVLEWPILIFQASEHRIEWTDSLERASMMLNT